MPHSPPPHRYGLKGQLDATLRVEVTSRDPMHGQARVNSYFPPVPPTTTGRQGTWAGQVVSTSAGGEATRSYLVPFEFKSGREYMGHRGQVRQSRCGTWGGRHAMPFGGATHRVSCPPTDPQVLLYLLLMDKPPSADCLLPPPQVSLYLLLMEERYGQDVDLGLLWNIHNTGVQAVKKVGGAPTMVYNVACTLLRCAQRHGHTGLLPHPINACYVHCGTVPAPLMPKYTLAGAPRGGSSDQSSEPPGRPHGPSIGAERVSTAARAADAPGLVRLRALPGR